MKDLTSDRLEQNSYNVERGNADDGDDDGFSLPADTLAILNEFLRNKREQKTLETRRHDNHNDIGDGAFEENWQLSQFWYNEETKRTLTEVCLKLILKHKSPSDVKIALLSSPSLYKSVKNVHPNGIVHLFEYDNRFAAFGNDFVHYDYNDINSHSDYLDEYRGQFDIIIADPPFLSEECIRSTASVINKLRTPHANIILCSGQVISEYVKEYLPLNQCAYHPQHERNLANEFRSYANFDLDSLI